MNVIRCTVVEPAGTVSFIAHGDALPALVAACSANARNLTELFDLSEPYYHGLKEYVESGLAVFDELNVPGHYDAIRTALRQPRPRWHPVFRVVDGVTREVSLRPVGAGAVVFNLSARRIVQIMNSYREIRRNGRARIFDGRGYTEAVYTYRLPKDWALVP